MPAATSNRAAVFTSQPQDVEIYERGAWWPGKLLGWRHDAGGACQVWVRVEFAGVVEDAWVDLALLRLPESRPERHLTAAAGRGVAPTDRRAAPAASAALEAADDDPRTQHLPLVRDGAAARDGRPAPASGGRRRALEAAGQEQVTAAASRAPGRHRAPADPGRHRAADTGVIAAVSPESARPEAARPQTRPPTRLQTSWEPPPPRTELPPPGPAVRPHSTRLDLETDGLTRPMRLEDAVGSARRSRRDALSNA